jgi:uncharacterized repeat protein (TIGR03803 family)
MKLRLLGLCSGLALLLSACGGGDSYTASLVPLYSVNGTTDGANSYSGLTLGADGSFYGGTSGGGDGTAPSGDGTIFKLTPSFGGVVTYSVLYTLNGTTDGSGVASRLLQGADGNFYGTTYDKGVKADSSAGHGTIFKLSKSGSSYVYSVIHVFSGGTDGSDPQGNLAQGIDGSIYGIASFAGDATANGGTVFKLTPSGSSFTFSVIYAFQGGADGGFPAGGVTVGADGSLYGTTWSAGSANAGTVYKLTPSGSSYVHTVLHQMNGTTDGSRPQSVLTLAADGNLYGTTSAGGDASSGANALFKLSTTGTFTLLYTLNQTTDGQFPFASMVQGPDGNFYGTTSNGGSATANAGTLYKLALTSAGVSYTVLHTFDGSSEGSNPYGGLTLGTDGHFYGMTVAGGASGAGVIFKY